jgi:PqqD family protein of HPr-rel-A system
MYVVRVPGVALEPIGNTWAAFSPLSGETHLLNDSSAAMLECLSEERPKHVDVLCAELAALSGMTTADVADICATSWSSLVQAGVIRVQGRPAGDGH